MERRRIYEFFNFDEIVNFTQAKARSRRGRLVLTGLAMVVVLAIALSPGWLSSKPPPAANAQPVTIDTTPISIPVVHPAPPISFTPISIDAAAPQSGQRYGNTLPTPTTKPKPTTTTMPAPTTTQPQAAPPVNTTPATAAPAPTPVTDPPVTDGPIKVPGS